MRDGSPESEDHVHFKTTGTTIAVVATLLLAGQSVAGYPAPPSTARASSAIDSLVEQRMNEVGIVGLGAAIIVNKKLVWMKGYGFADKQNAVPFTPNTIMNIGSISKTFTGVALMRAVHEGKLSLDEDINTYLPFRVINPFFPDGRITLRQLATHTSGITDRGSIYEGTYHYGSDSPEPLGEFLKNYFVSNGKYYSRDNFLNVKPGTHREYSNIAAGLAGYIVEIAVGEKLNVYTRRHIFAPLRMDNTGWFLSEMAPAKHARLYVAQSGLTIPIPLYGVTTYPDGGVRTSVSDLSRFFIALLNDGEYEGARILEKKSAEEMLRFQYTESSKPDNVTLNNEDSVNSGIFWATKFDVTRIGHNGSDPGLRTMMLSDLSKEIGVILFTNTSLCDQEMRTYFAVFDDLWKYAVTFKQGERK
jgi:CubicO group peptidase (beta-lactamase class C family)